MAFDGADKMTLRVTLEKLSMNDVNVFPSINDHKSIDLCFAYPPRVKFSGLKGNQFKRLAKSIYKEGKIDTNLTRQRRKTPPVADETKH